MSENQQIEKQVCALLQSALFEKTCDLENIDWKAVFQELKEHTVASLLSPCINKRECPPELYMQWVELFARTAYDWNRIMFRQTKMLELLREHGIDVAIMKGAAASMYYPSPELRMMGDIDFYVRPSQFEQAADILDHNGYTLVEKASHHWEYQKDGVSYELHHYPAGVRADDTAMLAVFDDCMDHLQEVCLSRYSFTVFPPVQNGLVLLLHIMYHLESGLGLRQIMDWMMYADRCLNDQFFYAEFQPMLQLCGLEKLAMVVTSLCQRYFGLNTEITWCRSADPVLCEALFSLIMAYGNFGRKEERESRLDLLRSTRIRYHLTHPLQYFKNIHRDGITKMNRKSDSSTRHVFAGLYRLIYSIKHLLLNIKHGISVKRFSKARGRIRLFRELGVLDRYFE